MFVFGSIEPIKFQMSPYKISKFNIVPKRIKRAEITDTFISSMVFLAISKLIKVTFKLTINNI